MTLMVALIILASTKSHGTEAASRAMVQILNYCATNPDAATQYKKLHDYCHPQ